MPPHFGAAKQRSSIKRCDSSELIAMLMATGGWPAACVVDAVLLPCYQAWERWQMRLTAAAAATAQLQDRHHAK